MVTYDGVTVFVYHVDKGEGNMRHEHTYSHLMMCHAGSCIIRKEGRELVVTKYTQPVNLLANEWHEIEALEDGTVYANLFIDPSK